LEEHALPARGGELALDLGGASFTVDPVVPIARALKKDRWIAVAGGSPSLAILRLP
jgi:hypothetical protein